MTKLKPPVFVTGVNRSGTTMTCRVLGDAPGMCLWYEPNILWRSGFAYRAHERATAKDTRGWVIRRIRRAFERYQEEHGDRRIVEKSPPNVLRIGYLHAVMPEAKIVHIYRDGRAMLRSSLQEYETFRPYEFKEAAARRHILDRLKRTPWWEWPAYFGRFADGFGRRVLGRKLGWFGVRYPGWKEDRGRLTRTEVIAKQWAVCVETALSDLRGLPDHTCLNIRYEDVVSDPIKEFRQIFEFCEMTWNDQSEELVRERVHQQSVAKWREELSQETLDEAMPHMEPMLKALGYLDSSEEGV